MFELDLDEPASGEIAVEQVELRGEPAVERHEVPALRDPQLGGRCPQFVELGRIEVTFDLDPVAARPGLDGEDVAVVDAADADGDAAGGEVALLDPARGGQRLGQLVDEVATLALDHDVTLTTLGARGARGTTSRW